MSLECCLCSERRKSAWALFWHLKIDHRKGAAIAYAEVGNSIELSKYREKRSKEEKENPHSGRKTDYHDY